MFCVSTKYGFSFVSFKKTARVFKEFSGKNSNYYLKWTRIFGIKCYSFSIAWICYDRNVSTLSKINVSYWFCIMTAPNHNRVWNCDVTKMLIIGWLFRIGYSLDIYRKLYISLNVECVNGIIISKLRIERKAFFWWRCYFLFFNAYQKEFILWRLIC